MFKRLYNYLINFNKITMPKFQKKFSKNIYDYYDFHDSESEIEVELASPWQRIAAYIINVALYSICIFLAALLYVFHKGFQPESMHINDIALNICILILSIPFITAQWIMMSKTGQSIGKRLMKIKVINLDGCNPGFVSTVFIREILFETIVSIFPYLLIKIFNLDPGYTEKIFNYLIIFICLFMLFRTNTNRRTLQDYLAKTIVIKV